MVGETSNPEALTTMGLYKICDHGTAAKKRCDHAWWGSFRGQRVSLPKWTNRAIRTKEDADAALDDLKAAIRAGTFEARGLQSAPAAAPPLTFRTFAETYRDRYVNAQSQTAIDSYGWRSKPLIECFGDRPLADITTADVEDFIADLKKPRRVSRAKRDGTRTKEREYLLQPASVNRALALLRHMFGWAVSREYLDRTPFRRGTETLIKLAHEDNKRSRRLSDTEETALLATAAPHLRALIVFAVDTGARRGEMLELEWRDVDMPRGLITFRGDTTKSGKTRVVPIGTVRLKAVLDWLRIDVEGKDKSETARVLSNEVGEPINSFRTAWRAACRRAQVHGMKWHDLRHTYASRLTERGVPLSQVRDLLGHASITTTERYDNQTLEALQAAAKRLETGAVFAAPQTQQSPGSPGSGISVNCPFRTPPLSSGRTKSTPAGSPLRPLPVRPNESGADQQRTFDGSPSAAWLPSPQGR